MPWRRGRMFPYHRHTTGKRQNRTETAHRPMSTRRQDDAAVCVFVCVFFFSGAKEKPCVQEGEVLLKQDGAATSVTVDRWSEVAKPSCHGFLFLHASLCLHEYTTSKRFTCKNGKRNAIFLLYLTLGIEAYLRFCTISHFDELVDVVLECAML